MSRKILFVTYQDYANVSTDIAYAINAHVPDWEARVCSFVPHPFEYPNRHHLDVYSASGEEAVAMSAWVQEGVDILVWAEECMPPDRRFSFYSEGQSFARTMLLGSFDEVFANADCYVFHAGAGYRLNAEEYNRLDQEFFKGQIVSPDLWRLTDGNAHVLFGKPISVEIETLYRDLDFTGEIVVCHSPTNRYLKGTQFIDMAMEKVVRDFPRVQYRQIGGPYYEKKHLPHAVLCAERKACHVYIDQFSLGVGGVGMSCLEAMSDGLIALCTTHFIPADTLGEACPIVMLPTPTEILPIDSQALYDVIGGLCSGSSSELEMHAMRSAAWVRQNLDPEVFSGRFMEMLWPG